jgi:hypothetical protein
VGLPLPYPGLPLRFFCGEIEDVIAGVQINLPDHVPLPFLVKLDYTAGVARIPLSS